MISGIHQGRVQQLTSLIGLSTWPDYVDQSAVRQVSSLSIEQKAVIVGWRYTTNLTTVSVLPTSVAYIDQNLPPTRY